MVLASRCPKPACRNGAATTPTSPSEVARLDPVLVELVIGDHVDDLDRPHQRDQAHSSDLCARRLTTRTVSLGAHGHHARAEAEHRADRRPRRRAPLHRLRHRDQARVRLRGRRAGPRGAPRRAGRVPLHARDPPGHVPRPQVDDAPVRGLRDRQGDQRALPLPDRPRLHGPVDGLRPPHPARPRLRRPALHGRGRPHRRGHRHDRRHAAGVRRHPARPGLDLDDDQRAGGRAAAALRAGRRGAGRARRGAHAARPRTTCSRSTSPAATSSTRPDRRCA